MRRIEPGDIPALLERFGMFEDGLVTAVRILRLPAPARGAVVVEVDVEAMDRSAGMAWRLVRFAVSGVIEHEFPRSSRYMYDVLSFGLQLDVSGGRCVLALAPTPAPEEWDPDDLSHGGLYGKQYVIGRACEYEVLEGPLV